MISCADLMDDFLSACELAKLPPIHRTIVFEQ